MDDNNKNEMEQIQRGLEAFLEKEIDGAGDPGSGRREPGPPEFPEVLEFPDARREPQDVQVIGGPWSRGRARREWESREDEGAYAEDGEDWDDWEDESRWSPEDGAYEEEELYPEDYDFSILFDTVENRKLRHRMERRFVEGEEILCDS